LGARVITALELFLESLIICGRKRSRQKLRQRREILAANESGLEDMAVVGTQGGIEVSRTGYKRAAEFNSLSPLWNCIDGRDSRSLVDCLNNIRFLQDHGIQFVAVTQGLNTDIQNPATRFLLHVLGAAAEFERRLIREPTLAGRLRYQQDYDAGRVGKSEITVLSRRSKLPNARDGPSPRALPLRRQAARK
jgi:hypothetical protein